MIDEADSWFWGQRVFCASRHCVLHVTAQSPGVQGSGQWASVDGILYDRHSMGDNGGPLYCSACRKVLLAEHEAGLVRAAEAEARAAAARARAEPTEQAELFAATEAAPGGGEGIAVTDAIEDASEAEDPAHV
jgi:hypothetical protein